MKILLIEDNPGDARLIREMLREVKDFPFDLKWCDRLSSGLACLARERVGVVLLDLTLSDSQGLDTFDHIARQAPDVPIIILTILSDEMTGLKAVEKGAQDYLFKGQVDGHLLVRSIRYATGRKQVEEALWVSHQFLEITNRHTQMPPLLRDCVAEIKRFTRCAAVGIRILEDEESEDEESTDEEGNVPYQIYEGFNSEAPLYRGLRSFFMNTANRFLATVSEKEKGQIRTVCNQEGQEGYESEALIPICLGERILGVIHVADHREDMLPLRTVKLLERAALQLATAIQRVQLEEMRK